jgi:thiol-disulfide isomerase/thioredoxin
MILVAILCSGAAGCSLFKKNTTGGATAGGPGSPPPKFPNIGGDPMMPATPTLPAAPMNVPNATPASATKGTSMLAGTVVDAYHRPVGNAYVRWVNLEEPDGGKANDVVADAYGHFIIQGVKQGADYKLIARTKYNNKLFAGVTTTSAPNPRIVISIREDLVGSTTPDVPAPPAEAIKNNNNDTSAKPAPKDAPDLPVTMNVPTPTSAPARPPAENPGFAPGIVENPDRNRLPMLTIPNKPRPDLPQPPPVPTPKETKLDTGPTRVPSLVLVGNRVQNIALKDSKGQTWEYKKQGQGKLVLIDFWGTHCIHCRDSMPILNRMAQLYGARGLEVLGIAMEPGVDAKREADAVNKMCAVMQINYRQLMGRSGSFDAGKQVRADGMPLPTLYLIDEQGYIIWHHTGRPDPALLYGLERTIQARLNPKTY